MTLSRNRGSGTQILRLVPLIAGLPVGEQETLANLAKDACHEYAVGVSIKSFSISSTRVYIKKRRWGFGDLMLDRYLFGDLGRISQEAPVLVCHRTQNENPECAGNVACNLAGLDLGCVIGVVGEDSSGSRLCGLLRLLALRRRSSPTGESSNNNERCRVVSGRHQLLRIDIEETDELPSIVYERS